MSEDHDWPYFLHGGPAHGKEVSWYRAPIGAICRVVIRNPDPEWIFRKDRDPEIPNPTVVEYEVTGPGHMRYKP